MHNNVTAKSLIASNGSTCIGPDTGVYGTAMLRRVSPLYRFKLFLLVVFFDIHKSMYCMCCFSYHL